MIDLTGYRLTFDDEFNRLSVSATGSGTVWADTRPGSLLRPGVDIGYGQSAFVDASTGIQPFSIVNGALRIEAAPATGAAADLVYPGLWSSGLIQAAGSFSQAYGYFEMRADLPDGAGSWPGFWLLAADGHWPPELDIVETYGSEPGLVTNTAHTAQTGQNTYQTVWTNQPTVYSGFHTFGALWTPTTITFYYDGTAIGQLATPADMHGAMYPVVALAMSRGIPGTTNEPRSMLVDYVRAYSSDASATAVALQQIASPDGADTSNLHGAVAAGITTTPPATTHDTLTFHVSGDSWNGGPQFTVTVDGVRVGGTYEVSADHASGARQDVTLTGNFGTGPHSIVVTFINDAVGATTYDPATGWHYQDRNLFISGFSLNGTEHGIEAMTANTGSRGCGWLDTHAAVLVDNGSATFTIGGGTAPVVTTPAPVVTPTPTPATTTPTPVPVTTTPVIPTPPVTHGGSDTLTFHVSGDSWNGGPEFTVTVDGVRVGGTYQVSADHASGARQDVTLTGNFGTGPHSIVVTFINDAVGATTYDPATGWHYQDRNLFISGFSLNGTEHGIEAMTANTGSRGCGWLDTHAAVLVDNGSATFTTAGGTTPTVTPTPAPVTPSVPVVTTPVPPATSTPPAVPAVDPGSDTLTFRISGDSWNGAPAFTVTVDGHAVGDVYNVTALHALGQSQDISIHGDFGVGPHLVAITYINDANNAPYYDAATNRVMNDRNLFVSSVEHHGTAYGLNAVVSNTASIGWDHLDPAAAVMAGNGTVVFSIPG